MLDSFRSNAHSLGVKIAFGGIIIVFIFWGIGSGVGGPEAVATVNGSKISEREFATAYQQMTEQLLSAYPGITAEMLGSLGLDTQALQTVISRKVLEQESARTGIDVSPRELRAFLESLPYYTDEQGNFNRDAYEADIKRLGPSHPFSPDGLRRELLPAKFRELISAAAWVSPSAARDSYNFQMEKRQVSYIMFPSAEFEAAAVPTEEEIAASYASRESVYSVPARVRLEYIRLDPLSMGDPSALSAEEVSAAYQDRIAEYTTPEQVKARHILVTVPETASEAQVAEAETAIRAIQARIAGGEDFAEVAKETGQDGTAADGGDLGWFSRSQMVQEFADAAFTLPVGQLSEPVKSRFGFHLILVEDKKSEEIKPLAEVEQELRSKLAAQAIAGKLQGLSEEILGAAIGGKSMEEAAQIAGLHAETTDLVAADALGSLGIQSADVDMVMSASAGQVIGKVLTTNDGLSVLKVVEAAPKSVKPLEEVRDDVIFWLTREKSRNLAREAAEKARESFADARPAEYQYDIKVSEPFDRQGYIADLGMGMELVKDVFVLPQSDAGANKWLAKAYSVDDGAVLVSLNSIVLPTEEEWLAQKEQVETLLRQERAAALFGVYMNQLNTSAKIKYNPEVVARLTARVGGGA